eukprot:CAMPEP_0203823170 /NCGR_PEP_ID=MMETSP0115-20131106/48425_1 /ASSEMBLY_ACC=CAM_ASM_000227 /TAXON_ID=33651 /ORGANISM="Bicosoecid sp, Strain ms1" /LENGTH=50 /DNA_ID=CAMNT_0050732203 /DNA_START=128 /DNA_END=276 /DNA_ORIENTATION=-
MASDEAGTGGASGGVNASEEMDWERDPHLRVVNAVVNTGLCLVVAAVAVV